MENLIVIATGYEALFAYMLMPYGGAQLIKRIEFSCDSQTDCPLVHWENRTICYDEIARMIDRILRRYKCRAWGLACRSEQVEPITTKLPKEHMAGLSAIMETDNDPITVSNVETRFTEASNSGKTEPQKRIARNTPVDPGEPEIPSPP